MKNNFLKNILLLLIIQVSVLAQNFDWEWQNPLPTGADHNDAVILAPNKFMLFGNGSAVSVSSDAGLTWSISYIDPDARDIYDVIFPDQNTGYVVGTGGLIMKTTDGGTSWISQTSGVTVTLWDVDFINADTGYAVGASGNILKTTDGGNVWTPSTFGTTTIYKVHYVNDNLIFLGSASATTGRLLRSTNAGASWDNITANITGLDGTVRGIHFLDANTGWISNSTGKIYKTTDGGATGGIIYDIGSTSATIYEVKFIDANTGYAMTTTGRVLRSTNGGTNWELIQSTASENLYGLGILGVNSEGATPVLIGGDIGTILTSSNDGVSWEMQSSSSANEILQRVAFPNESVGYAVGGSITTGNTFGDILKTTNSGLTWTNLTFDPGYRTYSVFFHDDNNGYVGTQGPTGLYKTTNGGQDWTQLNTGTGTATNIIYDIKFVDASLGFAMYSSGQVARTTDGGTTWASISAGWGSAAGYEIFIVNQNVIYICGAGGRISKSTNGGLSFTQLSSLGTATLYSMHFFDENTGFISASGGRIYKTTNGSTFTEVQLPVTSILYSIRFVTSTLGWLGGAGGNLFYTVDGGDTWVSSHISIGSTQTIRDIRFAGARLWVVGTDGMIIRGFADPLVPVELTSFTASVINSSVILKWSTATETNNSGFSIERNESETGWQEIGFVPGYGTTTETMTYSFEDEGLVPGMYSYRLKQVDFNGTFTYYELGSSVEITTPEVFHLAQNYPNPFNPETRIDYSIAEAGNVQLVIFNSIGEEVAKLVNEVQQPGRYMINFNAGEFASGVYFYKLKAGDFISIKKMILLK